MGSYSLKERLIKGNILKVLKKEGAPMKATDIRSNLGLDKLALPKGTQEGWITWTLSKNLKEEGKIRQTKPRGKWELTDKGKK